MIGQAPHRDEGNAVGIALGETCIAMRSDDASFLDWAEHAYRPFQSRRAPDFCIDVRLTERWTAADVDRLLPELRTYAEGDVFRAEPALMACRVDWHNATMSRSIERALLCPEAAYKPMDFLLRGIYYGIYRRRWGRKPDAYLVHGCGILDGAHAFLFVGPSGAGKTTVARLANGRTVLNDEAVLLSHSGTGFRVAGTPLQGGQPERSPAAGDLAAILFLKQDSTVALRPMRPSEAYWRFLAQTLDCSALLDLRAGSFPERADFAALVAQSTPCYQLSFRMEPSFWTLLDGLKPDAGSPHAFSAQRVPVAL